MANESGNVEWENRHEQEDMTIGGQTNTGNMVKDLCAFSAAQLTIPKPQQPSSATPQSLFLNSQHPSASVTSDTNPGITTEELRTLFKVTQQSKTTPKGQTTIIIALTAHAFSEERSGMLEVGCDEFVPKPFWENILLENIADRLSVQYVYDEQKQYTALQLAENRQVFTPEALAVILRAWLAQLHRTVESCNDEEILTLIEQMPEQQMALKLALTDLVDNFRLYLIFDLTQGSTND